MNTFCTFIVIACFSFATALSAQPSDLVGNIQFTLKQVSETSWGVYVKPDHTIAPSTRTTTGSGQVTIVAPVDFTYTNLENLGGTWVENARVNGPIEASDKAYISFGFVTDEPKITLFPNEETLLFTFNADPAYSETFYLFENENDPFGVPNSFSSNPGNDFGMIDYGVQGGLQYYTYASNYGTISSPAISANHHERNSVARPRAVFTSGTVAIGIPK